MKIATITLLSIISMVAFFNSQSIKASAAKFAEASRGLKEKEESKSYGPGFEVYNKAPNTITIIICNDGRLKEIINIPSNGKCLRNVDLQEKIELVLYSQPTKIEQFWTLEQPIKPTPNHIYSFNAPGKTKYVTWNPAKSPSLYPQTGVWMGLLGTSDSGYSLKNNLSRGQIEHMSQEQAQSRYQY